MHCNSYISHKINLYSQWTRKYKEWQRRRGEVGVDGSENTWLSPRRPVFVSRVKPEVKMSDVLPAVFLSILFLLQCFPALQESFVPVHAVSMNKYVIVNTVNKSTSIVFNNCHHFVVMGAHLKSLCSGADWKLWDLKELVAEQNLDVLKILITFSLLH